jgi:hypothetical protein
MMKLDEGLKSRVSVNYLVKRSRSDTPSCPIGLKIFLVPFGCLKVENLRNARQPRRLDGLTRSRPEFILPGHFPFNGIKR